ncbi:MarC family protein [Shewanella sp. AS16]|uniref:MarC family protein n=1 Tax=Shewanella sp. AS16 TaxID=2907625 RepID=UPI002DD44869|nr:MarC family protein [Shewanella sp. AS16]
MTTWLSGTYAALQLLCFITFICFVFSSGIVAKIGENGLGIVTRGLILAVIGVQMLIFGGTAALPFGTRG